MKGVLEAINYCHNIKICHRDIKPENILINEKNEIKIIDFGFAKAIGNNKNLIGADGTRSYMAPEVLAHKPYDEKCDIWSIGHIFYILLAFGVPFSSDRERMQGKYIINSNLRTRSKLAIDLLEKFFTVNPDHRISASDALKHPWF